MNIWDCTFHGLHEWHNHLFEKLGWMSMVKHYNNKLKIKSYLDGIQNLENSIKSKYEKTRDADRRDDLQVLLDNVYCLKHCSNVLLNISLSKTNSEDSKKSHQS
jgi:hypothetical protein